MKRITHLIVVAVLLGACSSSSGAAEDGATPPPSTTEQAAHSTYDVDTLTQPEIFSTIAVGTVLEEVPGDTKPTPEELATCEASAHNENCDAYSLQMFDLLVAIDQQMVGDVPEQVVYKRAGHRVIAENGEARTEPAWFETGDRLILLGSDTDPAVAAIPIVDGKIDAGLDRLEDTAPAPLRVQLDGMAEADALTILEAAIGASKP